MALAEYICEQCGKLHTRLESMARRRKNHFCSVPCKQAWYRGPNHGTWKQKGRIDIRGYLRYTLEGSNKNVYEHRLVWELVHGPIPKGYVIHHRNRNKTDNRIENLEMLSSSDHMRLHSQIYRWSKGYDQCRSCGTKDRRHNAHGLCTSCYMRKRKDHEQTGIW